MSDCVQIKLRNRPNYLECDKYEISVNRDGRDAVVEYITCTGVLWYITIDAGFKDVVCVQKGSVPYKVAGDASLDNIRLRGVCTDIGPPIDEPTFLDLFPDFDLRSTKQLTELTDINNLKFEYTLGFDIPNTDHNFRLLKTFMNPNVMDNEYSEIEVEVITGSHIITESQLYVLKSSEEKIEVKLKLSVDHWARAAKDLLLKDLTYAEIQVNNDNIKEVITNQFPYDYTNPNGFDDPNNLGIWYPAVNYGEWIPDVFATQQSMFMFPLEYWRPWYYITGLLQRGFCKLGWQFKSPLFESEFGSKLITYIFDTQFGLVGSKNLQRKTDLNVLAHVSPQYTMPFLWKNGKWGVIRFNDVVSDAGGSLTDHNSYYSNGGVVNVKGKIEFDWSKELCTLQLVKCIGDATKIYKIYAEGIFESSERNITPENPTGSHIWEFNVEGISMTRQTKLCILVKRHSRNKPFNIRSKTTLEVTGVRPGFIEDETYELSSLIDNSYNFLSLLKGLAGEFGIKFSTDFSTRTVGMYQPYKADFWGIILEGFLIEETIHDITDRVDIHSYKALTPDVERARYIQLTYKKSNSTFTDILELKDPLWSKTVDLGEKFTSNTPTVQENEFFTAFANDAGLKYGSYFLYIPRLENKDHEQVYDVSPTLAIAHGNVLQTLSHGLVPRIRYGTWDDDSTNLIPTAYQFSNILLGILHNDNASPLEVPEKNLVYEVNKEISEYNVQKSLYDIVYRRWFLETLNNLHLEYLISFTNKQFIQTTFREMVCFYHLGRLITCRGDQVTDFHFCSDMYTPVVLVPQRQVSDLCGLLPDGSGDPEEDLCKNNPVLLIGASINRCNTFTIGGANNSPITTVVFEYQYISGGPWITLPNMTPISAQLCDPTDSYYVRATVIYTPVGELSCPSILTTKKLVEPCQIIEYEVACIHGSIVLGGTETDAISLQVSLPTSDTITILLSETNIDNQGWHTVFTEQVGNIVKTGPRSRIGGLSIAFRMSLRYGTCPIIEIEHECFFDQGAPLPCDNVDMELTCVQTSPGCFTFERDGFLPLDTTDEIKYRCSEDGGDTWTVWKVWDQETDVCCSLVQAQWLVHFCDDLCPFTCTPVIECGACTPFEIGVYSPQSVCNDGDI